MKEKKIVGTGLFKMHKFLYHLDGPNLCKHHVTLKQELIIAVAEKESRKAVLRLHTSPHIL